MNEAEVRKTLYEWHSGQYSAVYAAASSGIVADESLLDRELAEAQVIAYEAGNHIEVENLKRVRKWLEVHYDGPHYALGSEKVFLTLPWCASGTLVAALATGV